ncbi:MAG: zinc-ribbon domain-containing protein [Firmicutes bacterium]|nr:zinc-ribbon domain-containing protein [Bacillota bacterium]
MFCTKCGKELHDDDRFCAYCGAAVREVKRARYDDVVFNPPFRAEAQRRTEEILRQTEAPETAVKRESVSFDWNLEGFPSAKPKKTEEVDFNWDSVVETRRESRQIRAEKINPEEELFFSAPRDREGDTKEVPAIRTHIIPPIEPEPEVEEIFTAVFEEKLDEKLDNKLDDTKISLTMEALERELFGDPDADMPVTDIIGREPVAELEEALFGGACEDLQEIVDVPESPQFIKEDEKFYTYNQKFDAFQQLLEQERERLRALEDSYNKNKESMDYTWVGEIFPQEPEKVEVVEIVAPSLTMAVDIVPEDEKADDAEISDQPVQDGDAEITEPADQPEEKEEVPQTEDTPSKEKLRYSDVFPRGIVDDGGSGLADVAETEEKVKEPAKSIGSIYDEFEEDDEPRKHTFAKVIITLLILLILGEGVIIAAKFIAPESKISLWANEAMEKVIGLISGDREDSDNSGKDESGDVSSNEDLYMESLVASATEDMKTIGEAYYASELSFDKLTSYSFDEIAEAEKFEEADWFTDSQGNVVTYGKSVMEALLRYYDSWQGVNKDESLVGINSLEIGEIRTGDKEFYVLCRVTYAGADGGRVEKNQTVHLKISDKTMIINEIKEDN